MKFLFVIFLVVPLVEIYLLIKIGSVVGAGVTIFLVVFTAFLGAILVRAQGFSTLARMQAQMATAQLPPPLRRLIIRWIIERGFMTTAAAVEESRRTGSNRVIDVEYRNID